LEEGDVVRPFVRPLFALLVLLSFSAPALADVIVPPKPPTYRGDKWAWERAVKRCTERATHWSRDRCVRLLYER
jgi:hypothetical protein